MKKNEKMFVTSNEVELAKYIRINAIKTNSLRATVVSGY